MIPVLLTAQSLVFLLWVIEMFRVLFHLRAMAEAETGRTFSGPVTFLRMARGWLIDPTRRPQRLRLLVLTLVLFALIGMLAFAGSTAA